MTHLRRLAMAGAVLALDCGAALAHGGHAVPAGIPAQDHLHVASGLMLPGFLLPGLALGAALLVTIRVLARRSRSGRSGDVRGSVRRHR